MKIRTLILLAVVLFAATLPILAPMVQATYHEKLPPSRCPVGERLVDPPNVCFENSKTLPRS